MIDRVCFSFATGSGEADGPFVRVEPGQPYDANVGYGFAVSPERGGDEDRRDWLPGDCADNPVPSFVVDVADGNYRVTATLCSIGLPAEVSVKTGPGRLMLAKLRLPPGEPLLASFAVHVDDGKLKLAFFGAGFELRTLEIQQDDAIRTLYLAGDSTVTDQPARQFPYTGWGQTLPLYFGDRIAVANHARSGRSSKSFVEEGRLDRILARIRTSDWLFVQFAHNDEKTDQRGTDPHEEFPRYLRMYIDGARKKGAHPALVTPPHRRFFREDGRVLDTHGEYIAAIRIVGASERVPVLDLSAETARAYEKLGPEACRSWFMPGDNTHFCEQGALAVAGFVAREIAERRLEPLWRCLRPSVIGKA